MADQTDFTPELTLTPNLDTAAAAAVSRLGVRVSSGVKSV